MIRSMWLGLIGVVALVVLATACSGADQVTGRPEQGVAAGDYQLTVTAFVPRAEPPDRFTNPKPGNRFARVDFTVVNTGAQHLPVAAGHFVMKDTGDIANSPREGISADTVLKQTSLGPGQRVQATLYFEVAANQTPTELVFTPAVVGWRTRITIDLK